MSLLEIPAADLDDIRDAALFRFWIRMASTTPSKVALAISSATTPKDYRKALYALALDEGVNLP